MTPEKLVRFLLVEDDDDHADLAIRALNRGRILNSVDRVIDGVEALRFLRAEGEYSERKLPHIVLLDLKLPKKSGLEVLREIREDPNLRTLTVVILSTSGEEDDITTAYDYNVNSFLRKPIDFEQFRQMVEDLCLYWGVWNEPPKNL